MSHLNADVSRAHPFRRVVANLDFEESLVAQDRQTETIALPRHVQTRISALGTLMRVFCTDRDRLWTPSPISSRRLTVALNLAHPNLESGPPHKLVPASASLYCGGLHRVDTNALSTRHDRVEAIGRDLADSSTQAATIPELVWTAPRPPPRLVRRLNDRVFHFGFCRTLKLDLPGSAAIYAVKDALNALDRIDRDQKWVFKPCYSAAGRDQIRGCGRGNGELIRRITRLLGKFGRLVFEPWLRFRIPHDDKHILVQR